jgi:hypothetical protein
MQARGNNHFFVGSRLRRVCLLLFCCHCVTPLSVDVDGCAARAGS